METSFYTSGGTLSADAPSYITRRADHDLYEGLRDGRFCYVLTSRQMGKSSLRNRTARRLREAGAAVAELDLTAIGRNLSAEQWYDGLVYEIGKELGLKRQLNASWQQNIHLGPLHRLMCVLSEGILREIPGNVVIFIDEIEVVRSLTFSTDEFFAALRACYNLRGSDESAKRLTFCLLGMATPSDLIRDTRITPFNIGRRIDLTDFTSEEARILAAGLARDDRDGQTLLERALYWTGGHPYLTQRVCQAVAEKPDATTALEVDMIVAELFLSTRARESDANLVPVREYLLRNSGAAAGVLDLYKQVRSGRRIQYDETSPLIRTLNLSGITHVENGFLRVRNRIYAHVFDLTWVAANMPDAEIRRQKTAYRRGILRTAAIAGVIIAIMGGLVWEAVREKNRADINAKTAREQERQTHRLLYVDDMYAAQSALKRHDVARALSLLKYHSTDPDRGFDYYHLWHLCHQALFTLRSHTSTVYSIAFSPDSKLLATAGQDGTVVIIGTERFETIKQIKSQGPIYAIAFSPNGKWFAFAGASGTVSVVDTNNWRDMPTDLGSTSRIAALAFSPDSKWLAYGGSDARVRICDTARWSVHVMGKQDGPITTTSFSPDSRRLVTGGSQGRIMLWDTVSPTPSGQPLKYGVQVTCSAFSTDGRWLAVSGVSQRVDVLDTAAWRIVRSFGTESKAVNSLAFSTDNRQLAAACDDRTIQIYSLASDQRKLVLDGHTQIVSTVTYSPNGKWLASGSWDGTVKLWRARKPSANRISLRGFDPSSNYWMFSRDGTRLATVNGRSETQVWNAYTGQPEGRKLTLKTPVTGLAFTGDSRHIAFVINQHTLLIYDPITGQQTDSISTPMPIDGAFAFSPKGDLLAVGSQGRLQVWKLGSQNAPLVLSGSPVGVRSATFSGDGKRIAAGCEDRSVYVWDLSNLNRNRLQIEGHSAAPTTLSFSSDGRTLASGSIDRSGSAVGVVKLWDIETQRETVTLTDDLSTLNWSYDAGPAIAFYADGLTLAMVEGGEILLWK